MLQRQIKQWVLGYARGVFNANSCLGCGVGKSLCPSSTERGSAHRKGPLNVENAVRTTGLLTAGRNPEDRTDPDCQPLMTEDNVTHLHWVILEDPDWPSGQTRNELMAGVAADVQTCGFESSLVGQIARIGTFITKVPIWLFPSTGTPSRPSGSWMPWRP